MLKFFVGLAMMFTSLNSAQAQEGEGALSLVYHPIACVMPPCPQFKITSVNGNAVTGARGEFIEFDSKKLPVGIPLTIVGTWTMEDSYFVVRVKEWIVAHREKVEDKASD
jgi:hypothetical protein